MKKVLIIGLLSVSLFSCKKECVTPTPQKECGVLGAFTGIGKFDHEFLIYVEYSSGIKEWISIPKDRFISLMLKPQEFNPKFVGGYDMKVGTKFCK
jgi:hypothetical protein